MALSELPVNRIARNGIAMGRSKPLEDLQSPPGPRIADKLGEFSKESSKVRGMLKNTTETGDVGPFFSRPSRFLQTSPRRVPTHSFVSQQDADRRSSSKQRHGDLQYGLPTFHPSNLTFNSLSSGHVMQSQRSQRPSSRGPISDDDRSYSMTRSLHTNRSVPSPRLPSSHRFQGHGDVRGARPRSPYVYPTRLKRPGYRPSSPAYSDLNRQFPPPHAGFYPDGTSRTQSQMSIPPHKTGSSVFRQGTDLSSDSPYSSSSSREHHRMGPFPPVSTFVSTPDLHLSAAQSAFDPQEKPILDSVYNDWSSRRSASPLPIFYDYTEAFEEGSHFYVPVSSEERETISPDSINLYNELDERGDLTNAHGVVERETQARSSGQEVIDDVTKSPQSQIDYREASMKISRRNSLGNESSPSTSQEENDKSDYAKQQRLDNNLEPSPGIFKGEGVLDPQSESHSKSDTSRFEATASETIAHCVDSDPRSVSSGGSMYSVQSSTRPENSSLSSTSANTVKPLAVQDQPGNSLLLAQGDLDSQLDQLPPLLADLRERSFDRWSDSEPSQIFAPTPERSISSVSHRHRFSRILSICEGAMGDRKSNNPLKRATSDQNAQMQDNETVAVPVASALIPSSRPVRVSVSLPRVISAEEESDCPTLDATMRECVSDGKLGVLQSTESTNDPTEFPRIVVPTEPILDNNTPFDALKPVAEEKPVQFGGSTERINQPARVSGEEQSKPSAESIIFPENTKFLDVRNVPNCKSCSPPLDTGPNSLPNLSTPALANKDNDKSGEIFEAMLPAQKARGDLTQKPSQPRLNLRKRAEKASIESLPGSRPWNLATSYPWTDKDPKLDVTMPETSKNAKANDVKLPRFKLKIHRASSSTIGPVKAVKHVPPPLDLSTARKTSLSSDLFCSSKFNCKPRSSMTIPQNNSSHIGSITARLAGNSTSPLRTSTASPCISLVPPSPGLNIEVRSFFSDDSSQVQPKGSLRKRISQLRAMATKGTSSDDVRGAERSLLSSAMGRPRASGRSIKQEEIPSEGLYNLRHIRWRLEEKFKGWLHQSKDRVRSWRGKMRLPGPSTRPGASFYSGI